MRLILLIIFTILGLISSKTFAVDADSAVEESVNQILSRTSSPEALGRNFLEPLLTDVPLTTLDGSKSGPAKIACPGTKTVFRVLIQPSFTKDLQFVSVAYDTDYDGKLDHDLNLTLPVSGVCANGFVSCTPGTWQDCHWYTWKYENGTLSYEEVSPGSLGGCYCINDECTGAPFTVMKNQILKDLGGGIAGALASSDPKLAVSQAEIEDFVIRYYGENVRDCSLPQGSAYGFENAENFYENSALLVSAAEEEVASQSSDPESLYHLLTHSSAFISGERLTCQIHRTVYFDPGSCSVKETFSDSCTTLEAKEDCRLETEKAFDVNGTPIVTYQDFNPTGVSLVPTCDSVYVDPLCSFDTPVSGSTCEGFVIGPSTCGESCVQFQGSAGAAGGSATIILTLTQDQIDSLETVTVHWCTNTHSSGVCFDDDGGVEVIINGQQVLHVTYSNCEPCSFTRHIPIEVFRLGENTIVFRNWAGKKPGSGCRPFSVNFSFHTQGVEKKVCRDWWKIERTYVCTDEPPETPDLSRAHVVAESLTQSGSFWTYQDPEYGEGKIELESETGESCIKACKLRIVERRAQASSSYTTADYRHDSSTQFFVYRTCVNDTCPVKGGEEIVEDCKCLNEFDLAYGVLESLRQASMDMTCSSGVPKP